jgi:lipopolysaccharide export system protein LptC
MAAGLTIIRWVRAVAEQLTVYLPVLLMALLALGSFWLLKATPGDPPLAPPRAEIHQPHHVMLDFAVRTYGPSGSLSTEATGKEARLFPDDGSMEMDQLTAQNVGPTGAMTRLSSDRGWTNKVQDEFVLRGNAHLVHQKSGPHIEFRGEHLRVLTEKGLVLADEPILMLRDSDRVTGNQLEYNNQTRVAVISGRVRARLAATP